MHANHFPIVLVVALDAEIAHLGNRLDTFDRHSNGIWTEHHARLGSRNVVVVQSGVGMTASAAATEHAIASHAPSCVLNYGSAGSHVRDVLPGDIVIAERVIACNTLHVLSTGEELFVDHQFRVEGQSNQRAGSVVECDAGLIASARRAARNWTPPPWPDRNPHGYQVERTATVRTGTLISADMWVQFPARIDALHRRHQSLAADMEAAAIGQVASMHGVPFLAIKDISNNEFFVNTDIQLGEIKVTIEEVGKRSAELIIRLLEDLIAQES
jgi:adenosylhomocysteine nucleosidase